MEKIRQLKNLCGIDVGCTNIKMTAIKEETVVQKTVPSGDDLTKKELIQIISDFYTSFHHPFRGLGIAFSGCTIDAKNVLDTSLLCLTDLSVNDFSHLNCEKIYLINDANATTLAGVLEYPEANVLLGITNGTGTGCGIAIHNTLFTGANGLAGQIYGNPTIGTDGKLIKSGKICSGSKVLKKIQNMDKTGCKKMDIIQEAASYLGIEIVSLIHAFNPDVLYLSGGGFRFPGYWETLIQFIHEHTYTDFLENLRIVGSSFSLYSGCFGAMYYVLTK